MFDEAAHPRGETGSAQGGKFVAASSSSKAPAKSKKAALKRGGRGGGGTLSYNGKTGTGYGSPNGDARVKALQQALNRLGLKDSKGRPLKVDGKLGPLTTSAVMAAQKRAGLPPTGKVTPALLKQLTSAKSLGKDGPAKAGTHKRSSLTRRKRALKTSAGKKPAAKAKPKPQRPKLPPAVQRAIDRIPANQRK